MTFHSDRAGVLLAFSVLAAGCASDGDENLPVEPPTVAVLSFEVNGQDEGGKLVSRAFAESTALNLAQAAGLDVVDAEPLPGNAGYVLSGRIERLGQSVQLSAELRDARTGEVIWQTDLRSETGDLSQVASCLARQTAAALGTRHPHRYVYVGNVPCLVQGPHARLMLRAIAAWRRNDLESYLSDSSELVARQPDSLLAQLLSASALAQLWDAAPTTETMDELKHRFSEMDRVDPANPYTDVLLAYAYRSSGEPGRAKELYRRLLGRDDLSPSTRSWILRQSSYASLQTGDAAGARRDAEQAIRFDPSTAPGYFALSRALESLGDLDGARRSSEHALALEPLGWR
jgi:TolB-like protein